MKEPKTLMIDPKLYSIIKLLAVLKKVSISSVIEEALKLYLLSQKEIIEKVPENNIIDTFLAEKTLGLSDPEGCTETNGENNENQISGMD